MKEERFKVSVQLKTVWRFAKKYKMLFFIAEICILISYAISVLLPLNMTKLVDKVFGEGQYGLLPQVMLTYAVLFITAALFNMVYAYVFQTLSNRFVVDVKNELYRKVIYSKAEFYGGMNTGDIMSRIDKDANQFIFIVQRNIFHFLNSIIMSAAIVYMIAVRDHTVAVIAIGAALIPIITSAVFSRIKGKVFGEKRSLEGEYDGTVFDFLKGMREIKLFNSFKWAEERILEPIKNLIKMDNKLRRTDFFSEKIIKGINLVSTLAVYIYSVKLVMRFDMTVGVFLAVIEFTALLHRKMEWVYLIYLDWAGRKEAVKRINRILELEEEEQKGEEPENIQSIQFKDVSFSYRSGSERILDGVSFKINKGEKVGIAGYSGIGKTTAIDILLKLLEPSEGSIYINDTDLKFINSSSLRRKTGVIRQEILLFNQSVRFNLTLGEEGYSDEELIKAMNDAGLYDVNLDRDGNSLSGGQKQRIMIARILLKNADLIIMDEATSALDIHTENEIVQRIRQIKPGTTFIIISHRLNTIRECDRILVLDKGRIETEGTHDELITKSLVYKNIFKEVKSA